MTGGCSAVAIFASAAAAILADETVAIVAANAVDGGIVNTTARQPRSSFPRGNIGAVVKGAVAVAIAFMFDDMGSSRTNDICT